MRATPLALLLLASPAGAATISVGYASGSLDSVTTATEQTITVSPAAAFDAQLGTLEAVTMDLSWTGGFATTVEGPGTFGVGAFLVIDVYSPTEVLIGTTTAALGANSITFTEPGTYAVGDANGRLPRLDIAQDSLDWFLSPANFTVVFSGLLNVNGVSIEDPTIHGTGGVQISSRVTYTYTEAAAAPVPEPVSALLLGAGGILVGSAIRRSTSRTTASAAAPAASAASGCRFASRAAAERTGRARRSA